VVVRLLILGGTLYLGRHLVEAALARGHQVTLFNRGRTNPGLFPDVETIHGDRDQEITNLGSRRWDAVIDTSGYLPATVRATAAALAGKVDHYTFVSTISVYSDPTRAGLGEDDPVAELPSGAEEKLDGETYGALKARCERALADALPDRLLVVRPGLIVGRHDPTDRSAYWPLRMARGGDVLAPGSPARAVQLIDVRDLAAWMLRLSEARVTGTMNATGPRERLAMEDYLAACGAVGGAEARLTWIDEEFLLQEGVAPYSELPLWVPERYQAFAAVHIARALAAGLSFRPLEDTVRDILEWARSPEHATRPRKLGVPLPPPLSASREAELLRKWSGRGAAGAGTPDAAARR
jgi:2'-hydroxyisoflavone reductase